MRRTPGLFAVAMAALFEAFFAGSLLAAERVALVIGNAAYEHTTALRNPRNDAMDVARSLEGLGFAVIKGLDVDKSAFGTKLREFARASRGSKVTLLFYAGHGLQVEGENYLVPTDAKLAEEVDLSLEAYKLSVFLRQMRGATNLVFLDACRDNPLARGLSRSMGPTRSSAIGRGLGRVEGMSGTLVAYATQPGNVAEDGEERNSPFTAALLKHIMAPGLSVNDLLTAVTDEVVTGTGGTQQPWTHSSLRKPFYFNPVDSEAKSPSPSAVSAGESAEQPAARAYEAAERVHTVEAYEVVRRRFPGTTYAELARVRLGKLAETGTAGVVPGAEPSAQPPATPQPTEAQLPVELESSLGLGLEEPQVATSETAADVEYWKTVNAIADPVSRIAALQDYRTRFPGGRYVRLAAIQLDDLRRKVAAGASGSAGLREAPDPGATSQAAQDSGRLDVAFAPVQDGDAGEAAGRKQVKEPAPRDLQYEGEFSDCPKCPRMVVVPAGRYEMGSPSGEGADDEAHRHWLTLPAPIAIGMFEVRRGEFTRFLEETNRSGGSACWRYDGVETREGGGPTDPGFVQGENEPMVCVSWMDTQAYVDWLSRKTKRKYRLLSESEWEYAARGGTATPRYWDESETGQCRNANGADAALKARYANWFDLTESCDDGQVHTSEVGGYGPNGFGLYDMLGNAREWVEDCWHRDYADAPLDGSAWTEGGSCSLRVLRGGSWLDGPGGLRASARDKATTGIRFSANGFRVARALE